MTLTLDSLKENGQLAKLPGDDRFYKIEPSIQVISKVYLGDDMPIGTLYTADCVEEPNKFYPEGTIRVGLYGAGSRFHSIGAFRIKES